MTVHANLWILGNYVTSKYVKTAILKAILLGRERGKKQNKTHTLCTNINLQSHFRGLKTFNKKIIPYWWQLKTLNYNSHRHNLFKIRLHDKRYKTRLKSKAKQKQTNKQTTPHNNNRKSAQCLRRVRRVRAMGVVTLGVSLSAMTASAKESEWSMLMSIRTLMNI